MKKIVSLSLGALLVFPANLWAQNTRGQSVVNQLLRESSQYTFPSSPSVTGQSQYRFAPVSDPNLITVHVIGSVRRPGIHYLPPQSNLLEVIALAGGTTENAKIDSITISPLKPTTQSAPQHGHFDMEEHFKKIDKGELSLSVPVLATNDVIYIPEDKPFIDKDTAGIIAVIGAVATTVLSIVLIRRELRD